MSDGELSLGQMKNLMRDLYRPNPWIYWLDFGGSILLAHGLFALMFVTVQWALEPVALRWTLLAVSYVVCVVAYHRAAIFIHELIHLPQQGYGLFRVAWNVLCGIPLFIPSFVYYVHMDHHRRGLYGTEHDGEYVPIESRSRWFLIGFWLLPPLIPFMFIVRFYIFSPLGWLIPPLRRRFIRVRSSLVLDFSYERPTPSRAELKLITLQEIGCFVWCVGVTIALLTFARPFALTLLVEFYLVGLGIAVVNAVRALVTHRWTSDESQMTFHDQISDSVNFPRHPLLTELWAPVGIRFHATHHLFPTIPYHNLPEVHRRLMQHLPADSPYREANQDSLLEFLVDMWKRTGARRKEQKTSARQLAHAATTQPQCSDGHVVHPRE